MVGAVGALLMVIFRTSPAQQCVATKKAGASVMVGKDCRSIPRSAQRATVYLFVVPPRKKFTAAFKAMDGLWYSFVNRTCNLWSEYLFVVCGAGAVVEK